LGIYAGRKSAKINVPAAPARSSYLRTHQRKENMSNMQQTENYLLLFRSATWYRDLEEEKVQEIVTKWMDWYAGLVKTGVVESGRPLASEGKVVTAPGAIKDGPFAEAKETVGGYFIVNAKSIDEAVAVANQCPGLPYGVQVEVRPMLETCAVSKERVAKIAAALA
jgi:hypothetical protein